MSTTEPESITEQNDNSTDGVRRGKAGNDPVLGPEEKNDIGIKKIKKLKAMKSTIKAIIISVIIFGVVGVFIWGMLFDKAFVCVLMLGVPIGLYILIGVPLAIKSIIDEEHESEL